MDKTDLDIMRMLLVNSRASYQSIGNELNLSSAMIKNRIMKMIDDGTIGRFVTQIKFQMFGYDLIYAIISHGSEHKQTILDRIKLIGDVFIVINCIGNVTVIGIAVTGELEQKMKLMKKLVEPDIIINIFPVKSVSIKKLIRTDLLIIRHLIKYPRTSTIDIAKAINVSTRTVKRRLDFLIKLDIMRFSILYNPAAMRGFIQFSLLLDIDEKKYMDVVVKIYKQLGDYFLLPPPPLYQKNLIVVILYTDNVHSMDEMFKTVQNMDGVNNVELSIPTKLEFKLDWFSKLIDKVLKKMKGNAVIREEDYILVR
ncbi:MAG: winged helix-turn-helix transcriptional regulator [Thaumarchaeota archaeon]|nr:winged helix-turn-helix transcriptional regulator [Nitrososphaerota archaeon]